MNRVVSILVVMCGLTALWAVAPADVAARQSTEDQSLHAERSLVRGMTFMRSARFDDAVSVLTEALRVNPDHPVLLITMAQAQSAAGDPGAAMFHARRARLVAPTVADVLRTFRDIALQSGDPASALEAASQLVELLPDSDKALAALLTLQIRLDQLSEALVTEETASERFPKSISLLEIRADVLERAGETARLVPVLEQLASVRDVDAQLAAAYTRVGRIDDAARVWLGSSDDDAADENLLILRPDVSDPDIISTLDARGLVAGSEGSAETEPALRERVRLDPRNTDLLAALASAQMNNESWSEAGRTVERLVREDPRQLDLWVDGVAAFLRSGEIDRAVSLGRDALLLYPGYGPLIVPLSAALAEIGERGEAVRLAQAALERAQPDDAWAAPLRELLKTLDSPQ